MSQNGSVHTGAAVKGAGHRNGGSSSPRGWMGGGGQPAPDPEELQKLHTHSKRVIGGISTLALCPRDELSSSVRIILTTP